ncbi:hypothetical protein FJZ33_07035 [Candidatus Poribacteria bacterium]|nr:hypothetical protein [Candidatus Poribacteria bacterium]
MEKIKGPGGTPGGISSFILGLGMMIAGGFLFINHVKVGYGFWHFFGRYTQDMVLIPLLAGIGFLFFNSKSIVGWILTCSGALMILLSIIVPLRFYFPEVSLFNLIVMLTLLAGGIGLILRSLRSAN